MSCICIDEIILDSARLPEHLHGRVAIDLDSRDPRRRGDPIASVARYSKGLSSADDAPPVYGASPCRPKTIPRFRPADPDGY